MPPRRPSTLALAWKPSPPKRLPHAWYSAPFSEFLAQSTEEVIGHLARNSALNIDTAQRDAWAATILSLKQHLADHQGHLLLEFNIPA